ncbi:MAG: hypothetical protein AB7O98_16195 [Hyphomonadaceae bacterium]
MMPTALRVLCAAAALLFCVGAGPPQRIDYTLTPLLRDGVLQAVQVDLEFTGNPDGQTALRLPSSWGGRDELWRSIEGLAVIAGGTMRATDQPYARVLAHRPNARLHIRYRIVQDFEGAPNAEQGNAYRAVIQPNYFHFIGSAALVAPDVNLASLVRVRTRNLPRGWAFASDLQHAGLNLGRINPSITVGGDFRVLRASDPNIRVAIRGQWSFSDADFTAQVGEIIAGQRRFWGDESAPYLVTVIQLEAPNPGWLSIGGTGLEDAFAFFATPNGEARTITRTLAHEGLHTWIPGRIGGAPEQDEAAQYWLSEGFTDFFTGRVLVREGLWSPADFADDLNTMLRAYAQSPVRAEPNTRILADFWREQVVQQLPYQRGRLLATVWDGQLRARGRDLDDAVLEMRERARAGDPIPAVEMFPIVADSLGVDVRADIAVHVERGTPILLPEDVFAPCGRVTTRRLPSFHRGFDIEATSANNNVISGVDPSLPAYAAGMRDGMVLVRRDAGEIGNSELEIAYVVRDGETERMIRYVPRGHGMLELQQLELADDLTGERLAECERVLGGA